MIYNVTDPTFGDDDRDGIPNWVETWLGLDLARSDTDGDGLSDALEDRNQDGLPDPGETAPNRVDTDGDGLADGAEVRARTDAGIRMDHLVVGWVRDESGVQILHWSGRAGVRYRVQRSGNLIHWEDAPSGAGPMQRAEQTASTDGALEYQDPAPGMGRVWFYRMSVP